MATRLQSMGFIPIDFIDEDITGKSFQQAQTASAQRRMNAAKLDEQLLQNEFARQADPIRLRNIESTTSKNETEAKYAGENERTKLLERNARIENTVRRFINDAYDNGDFKGGDDTARKYNVPISPEWKSSAETRKYMRDLDNAGDKLYPGRPLDHKIYVENGLKEIARRSQAGEPIGPDVIYNVPGAPPPVAEMTNSKWRPVGNTSDGRPVYMNERTGEERTGNTSLAPKTSTGRDPAAVATTRHLIEKGIAKSEEEAWAMVQESKSNPVAMRNRVYNETLRATFGNKQKAEEAVADWEKLNKQYRATDRPPGVSAPTVPPPSAVPSASIQQRTVRPEISEARAAIARRVPRERVEQRLRERGIPFDPSDLDMN